MLCDRLRDHDSIRYVHLGVSKMDLVIAVIVLILGCTLVGIGPITAIAGIPITFYGCYLCIKYFLKPRNIDVNK